MDRLKKWEISGKSWPDMVVHSVNPVCGSIVGLVGVEASLCYPAALSKAKFVDQNIKRIIAFRLLLFRASGS